MNRQAIIYGIEKARDYTRNQYYRAQDELNRTNTESDYHLVAEIQHQWAQNIMVDCGSLCNNAHNYTTEQLDHELSDLWSTIDNNAFWIRQARTAIADGRTFAALQHLGLQ